MTAGRQSIAGIHHITAIAADAQATVDFYTRVLGVRLVKLTVNFDDPGTYHLYFGDEVGRPGTILTFFPFPMAAPGKGGPGAVSAVPYAVAASALEDWLIRLAEHGVATSGPIRRFGTDVIGFADPDGMPIELVAREAARPALLGFDGAMLCSLRPAETLRLLTEVFGYREIARADDRVRLEAESDAEIGRSLEVLLSNSSRLRPGAGTVHHIAFRARDDADQARWRERLIAAGLQPTEVIDRQYFHSIYFREPGGILFEIATDPPGFGVDETDLGTSLKLPPQYEPRRAEIERRLPPLKLPGALHNPA
jgi:glyoxalase family protein